MMETKLQRRQFFCLAALTVFGGTLAANELLERAVPKSAKLYSAMDNALGEHFISQLDLSTQELQQLKTPMRGHTALALDQHTALLFGRRSASTSVRVNFKTGLLESFKSRANRHFNGHACLSTDRTLLFTSETDYANKRGIIGIRELATLKQVAEYESYGLDPHDLQLMPDGKTLVVANGGIETHPDFERRKLNLDSMQPSLVYLELSTGKKLAEYRLPDHLLSIRHLQVSAKGEVAVALQYEGNLYKQQPSSLVAWQQVGGELNLLKIAPQEVAQLRGYLADIVYDPKQQLLVSASPRGHCVSIWSTATHSFVQALPLAEASSISLGSEVDSFLVSTSQGSLYQLQTTTNQARLTELKHLPELAWDNHLMLLA
ncbi:DUF1513 domain-containing protein [uncultured Thiothrix sp.]|uniref:DUF1513 domain-containing protein n=1 Tax=uncultured Thiothrix sp. TaxID=223185 RepID=UPI002623C8DA|nr:DUF1513 domain-containing protein [uncultured Thiothrix sp.]HMT93285.1 DUF1513 domain-containing protein [Thiolinea sp.]